ncbi:MAG TPA: filamentous hemagglutinin N-terminal domain-containing protein [Candidatus Methylacidiphilales bacterium]|nr:filamentous hemagglutinin N-terminal domain-containing protein [Candidatus Methylacidiphilales bacterium]
MSPRKIRVFATDWTGAHSFFSRCRTVQLVVTLVVLPSIVLPPQIMWANPTGGTVTTGNASISGGPGNVTIRQSSDKAIVRWNEFSIHHGETTTFVQPSSSSSTLNRVTGSSASQLNGNLNANGRVYLVNPNGVVVGKTGRVNTSAFTASTHDVSDSDFLKGGDMSFRGNSSASVVNEGKIRATEGDVTLIARKVENNGKISAKKGSVNLAGGSEVLVKPSGTDGQRVFIKSGTGSVYNTGTIRGTAAELRAAGGNEYALAVNNSGVIRATAVDKSGGRIVLKAESGTVRNSGKLIASSKATGKKGGYVEVTGDKVLLSSTSRVDVSSSGGKGGSVRIGGGFQGNDVTVRNANVTVVEQGAVIDARGGTQGGDAIVWSEQATGFYGDILAAGGSVVESTTGGFAEISSRGYLDMRGSINTGGGTLLLDPSNIIISNDPSAGFTSITVPLIPNSASSVLNATELVALLNSQNVIVQTSGAYNDSGSLFGSDSASGDIRVDATVSWNSAFSLSLLAHDDVIVLSNILSQGGGDINIVAGRNTTATSFSGIVSSPSNYGYNGTLQNSGGPVANNGGNVYIGDGSIVSGIQVGTNGGKINVAGYDVQVVSGPNYVSLGSELPSSAINLFARHDVRVEVGTGGQVAKIGDGLIGGGTSLLGSISVSAGNDIILNSLGTNSIVQIGHGGASSTYPVLGGNINLTAGNDVVLRAGAGDTLTIVGHGGEGTNADSIVGNIQVTAGRNVQMLGGSGDSGTLFIGNQTQGTVPTFGGNIQVRAGKDIVMESVSNGDFLVIGHGASSGSATQIGGDIYLTAGGSVLMQGSATSAKQIGNGGGLSSNGADISGNIVITAGGSLVMSAGESPSFAFVPGYTKIGNGGFSGHAKSISGNIDVTADSIRMETGLTSLLTFVTIGHGGLGLTSVEGASGNINIRYNSSMSLIGGSLIAGIVQIGHNITAGGLDASISGDINVSGNGPLLLQASGIFSPAYIGHGSLSLSPALAPISGNISVTASSIRLTEQAINDPALLAFLSGLLSSIPIPPELGFTVGPIQALTFAKIGHTPIGISLLPVSISGDIKLNFQDSLSVEGGNGGYSLAFGQIGHGGIILFSPGYHISGNITLAGGPNSSVNIVGGKDLSFGGGNFALVGHSNIGLVFGPSLFDLPLLAPVYTSIGYTGPKTIVPTIDGNISISAGSLWIEGGQGAVSFAQIGHFTPYTDLSFLQDLIDSFIGTIPPSSLPPGFSGFTIPTPVAASNNGNILVALGGDLTMIGGAGEGSYAMIGHGSRYPSFLAPYLDASGNRSGQIDIRVGGESSLVDGEGDNALWWIGHTTTPGYSVTNADILFVTHTLDADATQHSDTSTLSARFAGTVASLAYGNLTFVSTNTEGGAVLEDTGGALDVGSPYTLAILSSGDLTINAPIVNSGGSLYLVSGFDSSNLFGVTFGATLVDTALFTRPSEAAGDLYVNNSLTFGQNISLISGRSISIAKGAELEAGEDFLAIVDNFNATRPSFNDKAFFLNEGTIRSTRASIYAVSPDLTTLGNITGLGNGSRTDIWFGDAAGSFGANYKLPAGSTETVLLSTLDERTNPDDRYRRVQALPNNPGFGIYYDSSKISPATGGPGNLHMSSFSVNPNEQKITSP